MSEEEEVHDISLTVRAGRDIGSLICTFCHYILALRSLPDREDQEDLGNQFFYRVSWREGDSKHGTHDSDLVAGLCQDSGSMQHEVVVRQHRCFESSWPSPCLHDSAAHASRGLWTCGLQAPRISRPLPRHSRVYMLTRADQP